MRKRRKILIIIILILAIIQLIILAFLFYLNYSNVKKINFGVTFSPNQARYFSLDPKEVLKASLDDLQIKKYRISAYWNVIEKKQGDYDFNDIDWQIDEIEKRGGEVILAIGRRLPHWPECHDPDWIDTLNEEKIQGKILELLKQTVKRYQNKSIIVAWQVENEPFLTLFGKCPRPNPEFYQKEVNLVRDLDQTRPIVMTESGELSTWLKGVLFIDWVGVSLYRVTWDKYFGLFYYPLTPGYYKTKAQLLRALGKKVFISELQAEPWERTSLQETPLEEQKIFMNERQLKSSIEFVRRAGFDEVYLWGIEWWYWLKTKGDNSMWETVKNMNLK